jgi:hypothetical protein
LSLFLYFFRFGLHSHLKIDVVLEFVICIIEDLNNYYELRINLQTDRNEKTHFDNEK